MNTSEQRVDPGLAAGNRDTLAGYAAQHFLWQVDDGVATHHAEPARAQEPAHLRLVRRAARPVRRLQLRRPTCKAVVRRRRRRQLLLRRRRARDHRPAGPPEGARAADVHAHDRRPGQGDARLPAADRRRHRRRVRRRRRDPRDGVATCASAPRAARPRSCSTASAWPAATWAPARCCRASSARAAPASCSTPAARWAARRRERWGFFNRLCRARRRCMAEAHGAGRGAGAGPDLRQRHHQDHAAPGVGHEASSRRSRPRRRRRRSAC